MFGCDCKHSCVGYICRGVSEQLLNGTSAQNSTVQCHSLENTGQDRRQVRSV